MSDGSIRTTQLHRWLERMQAGDRSAREELLRAVGARLEHLTRKMLKRFPRVKKMVETGDVLQNAVMRLLRSLEEVQPKSMREFYGLAAVQIRRELLDLARHFSGVPGKIAPFSARQENASTANFDPAAPVSDAAEMERWAAFHEKVAALSAEEREVVGLIFYHGLTQKEVAELFQVNVRTVRRWWNAALLRLHQLLGSEIKF